jgi:exonuclease 3'-5' domain-containing protein 1
MTSFDMIAMGDELGVTALNEPTPQIVGKKTPATIIDNLTAVKTLVSTMISLETDSDHIYMDLEGVNLSRHGPISLIQMLVPSCEQPSIVDIYSLGVQAFETRSAEGKSLKDVFESKTTKKYLFDVRNDADALNALFGVQLAGVVDIQLLELASRRGPSTTYAALLPA